MTDQRLTDELATCALGWRKAPGRYIKTGRSWIPDSRFRPLFDIRDAFRVADALTKDYSLLANSGSFTAEVRHAGRMGRATAKNQARAVSMAVAKVIGIVRENDSLPPRHPKLTGARR